MRRFFKVKNFFLISFLAVAGIFSAGAYAINEQVNETPVVEKANAAGTTAQNQDATRIFSQDERGYSFCTLHFYSFSYKTGAGHTYNYSDLEDYFTRTYGSRYTSSWNYQYKSGARWARNGSTGDYLIANVIGYISDDTNKPQVEVVLPWWVASFKFQYTNGSDGWFPSNGCSVSDSWGRLHSINCYYYYSGDAKYDTNLGDAYSKDFDAYNVTIIKKFSNGQTIGNFITNEARSSFDYYYPDPEPNQNGCTFGGLYSNEGMTTSYTAKKPSSDMTLYAKFNLDSKYTVIAKDKVRVWIGYDKDNPFYSYADANTGIRLWIHSTSSGGSEKVYGTIGGTYNNLAEDSRRYDYFDVDAVHYTNKWYLTVQKFQDNTWKAQTNPIQFSSENVGKVYYIWGDWAWDKTQGTVAASSVAPSKCDTGFANLAICGLHTCSTGNYNNYNGYGAITNYKSTFYDNIVSGLSLDDWYVNDYADGDTSYSGSTSKITNSYGKYLWMNYRTNGGDKPSAYLGAFISLSGEGENNSTTIIIIIASSVSLLSITALSVLLVKKRKAKQD